MNKRINFFFFLRNSYEQIRPDDGFGRVMQQHFIQLSIPLLSLPLYPDKESQRKRYLQKVGDRIGFIDSIYHNKKQYLPFKTYRVGVRVKHMISTSLFSNLFHPTSLIA